MSSTAKLSFTYKNGPSPASFSFIFIYVKYRKLAAIGNPTQIIGVDGEDADPYTTTTAAAKLS